MLHLSLCWSAIVSTERDKAEELYSASLSQVPKGKEIKEKSLLSFTKHAHLLVFVFYCISHCYKPRMVYFFSLPPFMLVTFQSQANTQAKRQTSSTYPRGW